jgi:U3 small nucleolar RNA-associated protein 10
MSDSGEKLTNVTGSEAAFGREIIYLRLYDSLLTKVGNAVVSYFSYLLDHTIETFDKFAASGAANIVIWSALASVTRKTMEFATEGKYFELALFPATACLNALSLLGFWKSSQLERLGLSVLAQVKIAPQLSLERVTSELVPVVRALAKVVSGQDTSEQEESGKKSAGKEAAGHEVLLKRFNSSLLHSTRDKDPRTKVATLMCIHALWEELGGKLLVEVPESVPFLVECLEEGEPEVEKAAKKVVKKIESHLGESLAGYMS